MLEQVADYAVASGLGLWGMAASAVGAFAATGAYLHTSRVRREDERVRAETREALESVPRVVDPMVEAITGELEVVRVCPHLSTFDRLDGLHCPVCEPRP